MSLAIAGCVPFVRLFVCLFVVLSVHSRLWFLHHTWVWLSIAVSRYPLLRSSSDRHLHCQQTLGSTKKRSHAEFRSRVSGTIGPNPTIGLHATYLLRYTNHSRISNNNNNNRKIPDNKKENAGKTASNAPVQTSCLRVRLSQFDA